MAKSKKSATFEAEGFIKGLRSLLDTLPSESQKREINNALAELISFLANLQNTFQAMPSTEDVSQVSQSLSKLEELFASVKKVPAIAASVGIGSKPAKKGASARTSKVIEVDAKEVLVNLSKLPADEIRSQLENNGYTISVLRDIASDLGARPAASATKKSLVDKIANDIVNRRMLDGLAAGPDRELSID